MKRTIKYWLLSSGVVLTAILLLANNKARLESGIHKENITSYSVRTEPVRLEVVKYKTVHSGITEAINDIELLSETSGKITAIFFENGSSISRNAEILRVDDRVQEANFKAAEALLEKSRLDLSRFEALTKEGNISNNELENSRIAVKNAEAQYALAKKTFMDASVKSPINGVLVNRYVNTGSTITPGTAIANIIDISSVKIKVDVPESEITRIKKGSIAIVTSFLLPGKQIEAKVINAGIKADDSHNYTVELILDNRDNMFTAGMYVDVQFEFITEKPVLTISRYSLTGSIKDAVVYVSENGYANQRRISIGGEINDRLMVLSGLKEGEQVIIEGQNNLQAGINIIVKNK